MRIAYVTINIASEIMHGGVGKKIKSQMGIWHKLGHEALLFSLSPSAIPFPDARVFLYKTEMKSVLDLPRRELSRTAEFKRMFAEIKRYQPDVIYLRFGLYFYPLHWLFKLAPVILETNSNDIVEYRTRGTFFYWMNRLTRNLTIGPASGVIVPSQDLVDELYPDGKKKTIIMSNGINMDDVEILPPTGNKTPVITLVGSPGMNWHGVDKLISLGRLFPDLTIHIVGYAKHDVSGDAPPNVHLHGFLGREQIREIFMKTDVASGSLALHRIHVNRISVLKIREALAYGLPILLANSDTDLEHVDLDTILKIPNHEENVIQNAERIRQFAYDMIGRRVDIDLVAPYLDQRKKEENRLAFFEAILAERQA